jgi:hypothetical protein
MNIKSAYCKDRPRFVPAYDVNNLTYCGGLKTGGHPRTPGRGVPLHPTICG